MVAQAPMSATGRWVEATVAALAPLADPERAVPMAAYKKGVVPFLGIPAPARRSAQRDAWRALPALDEPAVSDVCRVLWAGAEREFQYTACDLIARTLPRLSPDFVPDVVAPLLTDKPWWDTVDALGTAAVTPLVATHPELVPVMWQWLDSGDRWLIRAAIQHQRGRKEHTDIPLLLAMCDPFASDPEFFIA